MTPPEPGPAPDADDGARGWLVDPATGERRWSTGRPTNLAADGARPADAPRITNRVASAGLALGILGLALSLLLGPWVAIGAIVCSAAALPRAQTLSMHGYAAVGRRSALTGIALGVLGLVVAFAR